MNEKRYLYHVRLPSFLSKVFLINVSGFLADRPKIILYRTTNLKLLHQTLNQCTGRFYISLLHVANSITT